MIGLAAALGLGAVVLAAMWRLIVGPTLHDRAMAAYVCLICITLWIAALAVIDGRPEWIDVALVVAMGDFVLAVGVFKALRLRSLQTSLASPSREVAHE